MDVRMSMHTVWNDAAYESICPWTRWRRYYITVRRDSRGGHGPENQAQARSRRELEEHRWCRIVPHTNIYYCSIYADRVHTPHSLVFIFFPLCTCCGRELLLLCADVDVCLMLVPLPCLFDVLSAYLLTCSRNDSTSLCSVPRTSTLLYTCYYYYFFASRT